MDAIGCGDNNVSCRLVPVCFDVIELFLGLMEDRYVSLQNREPQDYNYRPVKPLSDITISHPLSKAPLAIAEAEKGGWE